MTQPEGPHELAPEPTTSPASPQGHELELELVADVEALAPKLEPPPPPPSPAPNRHHLVDVVSAARSTITHRARTKPAKPA